jgi:LAO/AO transport system kinase
LPEPTAPAPILGITGSAGVGKSTLIAALIDACRAAGRTVGVLACDPQSPLSGGSLLGDRIRARFDPADEGVYFRSFSTRGTGGGISRAVGPAARLLVRCGFDLVIVETVGVGQDETAVRGVADVVALLVAPGSGDAVQWQKAGLIEVVDVVLVNKADLPGADSLVAQLRESLGIGDPEPPEVLAVSATRGTGIAAFLDEVNRLAGKLPTQRGRRAHQATR